MNMKNTCRSEHSGRKPTLIFIFVSAFLYAAFLAIDSFVPQWYGLSNALKFISIAACLTYTLFFSQDALLRIALSFTLIADACLLLLNLPTPGVMIFCAAQFCHALRFTGGKKRGLLLSTLICTALLATLYVALRFRGFDLPVLIPAALLYAFLLLSAVFHAFHTWYTVRLEHSIRLDSLLGLLGMLLFLLCDINVVLHNASSIAALPAWLAHSSSWFMWFFYLPSQCLLALSGRERGNIS